MPTQDADFIGGGDDYEEPDGDAGHDDGDNGTVSRRGSSVQLGIELTLLLDPCSAWSRYSPSASTGQWT